MIAKEREFDIVLFGATGFAGRLTARHLAAEADPRVRIALAGRSLSRLQDVAHDLGPAAEGWPLLVVDATDEPALTDLASRAQVVVTTVGPYVKYGVPLAAACAETGTHYCDLTGEVLFVHRSIAANHEAALGTGARIVHACGVDSIPSDLGVLLTAEAARADGAELGRTRLAVRSFKGSPSGGTIDTLATQADAMRSDAAARRVVSDPWALAEGGRPPRPSGERPQRRSGISGIVDTVTKASPVKHDAGTGHFTGPFLMASFNTRIVARSASLLDYGAGFRYSEHVDFGGGPRGAATAGLFTAALGATMAGLAFPPTRSVLGRVLPGPGEGPSEEAMASGRFSMLITAEATNGARYRTKVAAPYDPGYSGTAIMLGQAALALVEDGDTLPDAAGVLTPATAIGAPLVDRLRRHRFTFETTRLPG